MTTFRGKPACSCLAQWLPAFEAELQRLNIVPALSVFQLIGGAAASAGTHSSGGAFDIQTLPERGLRIAREMGAATWNRTQAQGFSTPHAHGVLNGCPHNSPARYQIVALEAGFSGLGVAGRGSRDDGPAPRQLRTWREGLEWAESRSWPRKYRVILPDASAELRMVGRKKASHRAPLHKRLGRTTIVRHGDIVSIANRGKHWSRSVRGAFFPNDRLKEI